MKNGPDLGFWRANGSVAGENAVRAPFRSMLTFA
jgi:hypothetical protein